jgi:hypothetical protein
MSFPCFGRWYISTNLELGGNVDLTSKYLFISNPFYLYDYWCLEHRKEIRKFVNEYLKQDGIFVLRMVSLHAGILFGNELVGNLYKIYTDLREQTVSPSI